MKKEIIEQVLSSNGQLLPCQQFDPLIITEPSVYEVIRIIDGVPLFLEDHMVRLTASAAALGADVRDMLTPIWEDIKKLIAANGSPNKNIKLVMFNLHKKTPDYVMAFVHSNYPDEKLYEEGIHTILVHAERNNPNIKITNTELKKMIHGKLVESNAYEALLVNSRGEITEGSKSNLFFVVQGKIYTASPSDVLIGITRQYIIKACTNMGLEVIQQPIPFSILDYAEGAFITGTSPKLLPIASIEEKSIDSAKNKIVMDILKEYDHILNRYIEMHP
jgi:branched-chain amino acid aminotransferase